MDKYPCIKCGLCCRRINVAVETAKELFGKIDFPYKWDVSGKCEMLGDDEMCKVYDNRPLICNIDKMAEFIGVNKKEVYELNVSACNELLKEANRIEVISLSTL